MRIPQVGRLVAFKLGGTATLPADPPPAGPVVHVTGTFPPATVAKGSAYYLDYCARCHGLGTRGSGILPELKRSAALNDAATWRAIVEDGSLADRGMIAWKNLIPEGAAESIRAYVAEQARAEAVATR
jgi:quinohemoprotein ethanol dehydrogenase